MNNMATKEALNGGKVVEIYEPFDNLSPECKKLIDKSKKEMARMDKADGGVKIIDIIRLGAWLRTVMTALVKGLKDKNFNLIADSYVMLSQIEKQVRELEKRGFKIINPILY